MKYILIALLAVFNPVLASAQRSNLYADIGIPADISLTYNYKILKHLGLGVGAQVCHFEPTLTNYGESVPAIFGDLRLYFLMRKKHFFFYFLDLGINFYKANDDPGNYNALFVHVTQDNGFYAGGGYGYFHVVTKRGGGWYVSLKSVVNSYKYILYNTYLQDYTTGRRAGAGIALSGGFKF